MNASRVVREPIPPFTWTDAALRWSVEIDQRIIDAISDTGAETAVLVGQIRTGDQQPILFLARERVPLVSTDFGELAAASLAQLESMAPGRARDRQTVGFVCPSRSALRHLVTSLGNRQALLPDDVLVLRATDAGLIQGSVWEPRQMNIVSLELEFPLEIARQPQPTLEPVATLQKRALPAVPPAAPVGQQPMAVKVEVPQWVWAAALGVILTLAGFGLWWLRPDRPTNENTGAAPVVLPAAMNRLGMSVKRADSSWEVQWDASRVAALGAQSALLQVLDGDRRVDIPLSPMQLAQGKVVYVPTSGDIELVLSANTAGGMVQDSVRVIGSPVARAVDSGSRARALSQPSAPAAVVPAAAAPAPTSDAVPTPQASKTVAEPPKPVSPEPALEPTMTAQLQPQQAQPITLRIETAPAPTAPAPTAPAPRVTPPPAATPVPDQPAGPAEQAPVAVKRVLSQPVALNKVTPLVPAHLRSVVPGGATVEVQVRLGADGRVLSATAAPASGVMAHLSRLAVEAAKRWRFEPAKLDGRPVESEHKITFRFGK